MALIIGDVLNAQEELLKSIQELACIKNRMRFLLVIGMVNVKNLEENKPLAAADVTGTDVNER
jgi:hypothetical protein